MLAEQRSIAEIAKELGVSENTYHRWRNQYGGMKADNVKRLRELERENQRLKRIVANQALDIDGLKEIAGKLLSPARRRAAVAMLRGRLRPSLARRRCAAPRADALRIWSLADPQGDLPAARPEVQEICALFGRWEGVQSPSVVDIAPVATRGIGSAA